MDTQVARQPIFNTLGSVVGYELLYRESATADRATGTDTHTMSARTIVSALIDIGLHELVGSTRAWINLPERALLDDSWSLLDRSTCVIEILETVPVTEETTAAIQRLVRAGYQVALDDYEDAPHLAPFLDVANVVKIDVLGKDPETFGAEVAKYKARGIPVLAERVEDQKAYLACRAAGFDFFQGYYFARPETVQGRRLAPQVATLAEALNRLGEEEFNLRDLERTFSADPTLTLKLLRIANSAATGGARVDSVRAAIALVGRAALRRWVAVLLAASGPQASGEDVERFRVALERARFAELVAEATDRRRAPSAFFAGLLSLLDAVLGVPMDEIIAMVSVTDEVQLALLDRLGPLAPPILIAEASELALWESAAKQAEEIGLSTEKLGQIGIEAARWARSIRSAI
ncbi:MAG: HDOD domain-containing protein [Gemmatimonadaceae bacterium]|nr:HDOD domain-containing protein [Gemmatimonadaceae bacterium]